MAFKTIVVLDADVTISMGGTNKKTNKKNPVRVEGYYLGSKTVADKKKKSGQSYIHIFQTAKGNVGVWGKTNLDNQIINVPPGTMTRATVTGMRSTPNGDMYVFQVEVDLENTVEAPEQATIAAANNAASDDGDGQEAGSYDSSGQDDDAPDADDQPEDQEAPEAIAPPPQAKSNAERNARVNALLGNKRK